MIIKQLSIKTKMICDIRKSTAGTKFSFFFLLYYNNYFSQFQMPVGPEVRVPRLIVSQRIWPTLPLLATKSGCTLSEVSVILEMYFKGEMNHCIMYSLTSF